MDKQELLPCPFCGETKSVKKDEYREGWLFVVCDLEKGGCGASTGIYEDHDEPIEEWNTRSLPALQAAAKGLGMCVVPLEPSEAMIDNGAAAGMQTYLNADNKECRCEQDDGEIDHDSFKPCALCEKINRSIYRAMTAAQEDKGG